MARRSGLIAALAQAQREVDRRRRAEQQATAAAIRAREAAARARQRATTADAKERQRLHAEARAAEVEAMNADIAARVVDLEGILSDTLNVDDYLEFNSLKLPFVAPDFVPALGLAHPIPAPVPPNDPMPPGGLSRWSKKAAAEHDAAVTRLHAQHAEAMVEHQKSEQDRLAKLEMARVEHEHHVADERSRAERQHAEIDEFRTQFERGQPGAVASYFGLVLQGSNYPGDFPRESRSAYVPESRQLVVEVEFPGVDAIPHASGFKYVKARDEITESPRPQTDLRKRYADLVAKMTLRTIHELFEANRGRHLNTLVFNGFVNAIDPATGKPIRPVLVSLRTTADTFGQLDLARVDAIACLKALNASVSTKPTELAPVRPVLEFAMVDPRFVEETDILSELDQRVNLMDLSPTEFESLISNLFERMGLETRQTRPSRDGGVDCVAYDPRPIFGGKVVIQAKRYKNTVGVSAVRDLFGTVQNEGASKGILVTTSGYGTASFEFAEGKPLELLDGANLLFLLAEHAGMEARIVPPEGWKDPEADIPNAR